MQYLGVSYDAKHPPVLDPTFIPFGVWCESYLSGAKAPIAIAVERNNENTRRVGQSVAAASLPERKA